MSDDFINMLGLYGAGATGRKFEKELSPDEISSALKLAKRYGVIYAAYAGAKNSFGGELPAELDSYLAKKAKENSLKNAAKKRASEHRLELYKRFGMMD